MTDAIPSAVGPYAGTDQDAPEPMITARELARRLHLDKATIYRMTARGEFPAAAVWRTRGVVRYDWALIRQAKSGGA